MYFQSLQRRLVTVIRERVRRGELTERGLARLSGVSQPHIHNVLKGVRIFSPEFADQVLRQLHITVLDLCDSADLTSQRSVLVAGSHAVHWVPRLVGALGPGHPWFDSGLRGAEAGAGGYPFPGSVVAGLTEPRTATLAKDGRMPPAFHEGDTVLLDLEERGRAHPGPDYAYVVDTPCGALVRYVRLSSSQLYVLNGAGLENGESWDCVSLKDRHILDVVRARIVWMGREMET